MKPELVMPAGSLDKLDIAIQYGADAVYVGVPSFSLRARENDFRFETVANAIDEVKSRGKRVYLTINIYPRNLKIESLKKAIPVMAEAGAHGFIVADPGVIGLCKKLAPDIPLHLSVQANAVNYEAVRFWQCLGIKRVILAQELSLKEIERIRKENPSVELEFFVHGSVCMAYSGRCLISNYLTHRDANQGTCTQSCRWNYNVYIEEETRKGAFFPIDEDEHGAYIMNSKDICLIAHLKELMEAGVTSFKIEGRSKSIYYVATVARAYRKAIDGMLAGKPFDQNLLDELKKTANRGFFPGFLKKDPGQTSIYYESYRPVQTHEFVAVVRQRKDEKMLVEIKNRFSCNEQIEFMTPDTDGMLTILSIKDRAGQTMDCVHGGSGSAWISTAEHIELPAGAILRRPVH